MFEKPHEEFDFSDSDSHSSLHDAFGERGKTDGSIWDQDIAEKRRLEAHPDTFKTESITEVTASMVGIGFKLEMARRGDYDLAG